MFFLLVMFPLKKWTPPTTAVLDLAATLLTSVYQNFTHPSIEILAFLGEISL